ncbi:MAG TPA: penicillin-binding transpeptidase domain-containing protein, partial [Pyrinomonadaceae bacterium]|nr:penicillin-binding transpeptidase domain-containing protein [Pyrinomonadaceae bacterium]
MKIAIGVGLGICVLLIALSRALLAGPTHAVPSATASTSSAPEDDRKLQQIAAATLGPREGTIVVMDLQTGRVRAVVNPRFAFQQAHPAGSTIKPFTALALLRAGTVDADSRIICREHYTHEDFNTVCSHERNIQPLNAAAAIAHSCNFYFGTLAEILDESNLAHLLDDFGFGRPTGINNPDESPGVLLRKDWRPANMIGEGRTLQVTPIQLLTAYAALANGGRLLQPAITADTNLIPRIRSELKLTEAERAVLLEGMRGAVRFGTAEKADLDS